MLKSQADEMNKTFINQENRIDSLRFNIDTIESLYVARKIQRFNDSLLIVNYKSQEKHYEKEDGQLTVNVIITILMLLGFITIQMID
jgi:hypothetical protein